MSWVRVPPESAFSLKKESCLGCHSVVLYCVALFVVSYIVHCICITAFGPIADVVLSCDVHLQGHVIMMTQPQSIYQRVIDKTKGLAFQAQFLDQSIDKRLQLAQSVMSKTLPPQAVCQCVCACMGGVFSFSIFCSLSPSLPPPSL